MSCSLLQTEGERGTGEESRSIVERKGEWDFEECRMPSGIIDETLKLSKWL